MIRWRIVIPHGQITVGHVTSNTGIPTGWTVKDGTYESQGEEA
jgi:hypothetical protein